MSVLVEAITVIFRNDTAEALIHGGVDAIGQNPPNGSFRTDGNITAIGFMTPDDVGEFVNSLKRRGFVFVKDSLSIDIAVCDQNQGFTVENDWLGTDVDERGVRYCWLLGKNPDEMITPGGWTYENSLYTAGNFRADEDLVDDVKFLRAEDKLDVYWDEKDKKEVYVGRTANKPDDFHTSQRKARLFATAVKIAYDALTADGWMSIITKMHAEDFPHLIMRYRNQLGVFFIDAEWNGSPITSFDKTEENRLRKLAGELNAFPISVGLMFSGDTEQKLNQIADVEGCGDIQISLKRPYVAHDVSANCEWNSADHDLEEDIELTNWEVHDFGVQVVRESLDREGHRIESYDSTFGTTVQITATIEGVLTYIVCRTVRYPEKDAVFDAGLIQRAQKLALRKSAVLKTASVSLANSDDMFDPAGQFAIPIFRGKAVMPRFVGLETPQTHLDG
jgi:hypothetical protein